MDSSYCFNTQRTLKQSEGGSVLAVSRIRLLN